MFDSAENMKAVRQEYIVNHLIDYVMYYTSQ